MTQSSRSVTRDFGALCRMLSKTFVLGSPPEYLAMYRFLVLAIVIIVFSQIAKSEDSIGERVRNFIAKSWYPEMSVFLSKRLDSENYRADEITHIMEEAVAGYADCVTSTVESLSDPRANTLLRLLADGIDGEELQEAMGIENYVEINEEIWAHSDRTIECLQVLHNRLGLKGEPIY